jgi:hypothetical protein
VPRSHYGYRHVDIRLVTVNRECKVRDPFPSRIARIRRPGKLNWHRCWPATEIAASPEHDVQRSRAGSARCGRATPPREVWGGISSRLLQRPWSTAASCSKGKCSQRLAARDSSFLERIAARTS